MLTIIIIASTNNTFEERNNVLFLLHIVFWFSGLNRKKIASLRYFTTIHILTKKKVHKIKNDVFVTRAHKKQVHVNEEELVEYKEKHFFIHMKTITCRLSKVGPSPQMWAKSTWHVSRVDDDTMQATPAHVAFGRVQLHIVKHGCAAWAVQRTDPTSQRCENDWAVVI